ncbi:MAG: succinate dehydrogenase assembly factor 2 [Pseudomonadales bacterium]|nr:succinate dehydrogenase assembly factor 2 [Pseudomonadales bacterium]MCP5171819.1 succinate dehydrogenase assembly factor 2 [Pseudomonadales bacterium]
MEKNRLVWASRRGMLELDLWLLPFVEKIYPGLDDVDKERYHKLLEGEDPDLFAWCMGHRIPEDPDLKIIVDILRSTRDQIR